MRNRDLLLISVLSMALTGALACGEDEAPPPPPPTTGAGAGAQPVQPTQPAQAGQPTQAGNLESNFGTIALNPGFVPDPHIASGTSGGSIQAQTLNSACRGWVSQTPDHIFNAGGQFGNLRFIVNGGANDLTLVVQKPDGTYTCNDDAEGRNPIVQGNFAAGPHKIWIGSYNQGVNAPYNLGISELSSTTASQIGAPGGGGEVASNFGTVTLAPGFVPDPHVVEGTSGGAVQASTWSSGCAGWVSQTPDHILNAQGSFNTMRVLARSSEDTTLVIQKPDGNYLCNDDTEGRNPIIAGSFPPGNYKVWVGSYRQGQNASYKLGFSELGSTSTRDLE